MSIVMSGIFGTFIGISCAFLWMMEVLWHMEVATMQCKTAEHF